MRAAIRSCEWSDGDTVVHAAVVLATAVLATAVDATAVLVTAFLALVTAVTVGTAAARLAEPSTRRSWQQLVAADLSARGVDVRYPQLPDPDDPDPAVWSALAAAEVDSLSGERRIVIAHSLAVWVMLGLLVPGRLDQVDRVLLVAPVSREVLAANTPIAAFAGGPGDLDRELDHELDNDAITAAVTAHGGVNVVCSDDDPYWPGGAAGWAERVGATVHPLVGQGHLALGDGYGRWDSVRDWVLSTGHGSDNGVIEPR